MKFIKTFNEAFYDKNASKYKHKGLEYVDHISKWRKPGEDDTYSIISGVDDSVIYVNDKDRDNKITDSIENFKSNFERIQDDKVDAIMKKPAKETPWTPAPTVEPIKQLYLDPEENEFVLDFDNGVYIPGEKAIIAAYLITGEDDNFINVMNIKEMPSNSAFFMDGAVPYGVSIHDIKLPKNKVLIIEPVDGKEGFSFIKLPYWLYKENQDLTIKKSRVGNKKLKRLDLRDSSLSNKELLAKFNDPNVKKYLTGSNPDERTLQLIDVYKKRA